MVDGLGMSIERRRKGSLEEALARLGARIEQLSTPVKSITGSLPALIDREPRPDDWQDDLKSGLHTIESRMDALGRFVDAFAKFARLPAPKKLPIDVDDLVGNVIKLNREIPITLVSGPSVRVPADRDQLEQVIINLLKNASEAVARVPEPNIAVTWRKTGSVAVIEIADNGPGIAKASNPFGPFFTTKKGGSGIGLALSRQIAESHGGTLSLENTQDGGCVALLEPPTE